MASPLAHGLVSLAIARELAPAELRSRGLWYGLMFVASCAPDFDFLIGAALGDINRYHHGPSHSLGLAVLFGGLASLAIGGVKDRLWVAVVLMLSYASHLLLDAFSGEPRLVNELACSQPVFWPLSPWRLPLVWPIFKGIHHGLAGDELWTVVRCLTTRHNLDALLIELAILGPLPLAAFRTRRRERRAVVEPA